MWFWIINLDFKRLVYTAYGSSKFIYQKLLFKDIVLELEA
jgi:hypothetical protein